MRDNWKWIRPIQAFASAAASGMALILGMIAIGEPRGLSAASLGVAVVETVLMAVGYAVALYWLPARLGRPASTRAHSLAGLASLLGFAALSTQVQGVSLAGIASLSLATGTVMGLLQWARTLRSPRPPKPSLEELENEAEFALQQALTEAGRDGVLPLTRPDRVREPTREQVA